VGGEVVLRCFGREYVVAEVETKSGDGVVSVPSVTEYVNTDFEGVEELAKCIRAGAWSLASYFADRIAQFLTHGNVSRRYEIRFRSRSGKTLAGLGLPTVDAVDVLQVFIDVEDPVTDMAKEYAGRCGSFGLPSTAVVELGSMISVSFGGKDVWYYDVYAKLDCGSASTQFDVQILRNVYIDNRVASAIIIALANAVPELAERFAELVPFLGDLVGAVLGFSFDAYRRVMGRAGNMVVVGRLALEKLGKSVLSLYTSSKYSVDVRGREVVDVTVRTLKRTFNGEVLEATATVVAGSWEFFSMYTLPLYGDIEDLWFVTLVVGTGSELKSMLFRVIAPLNREVYRGLALELETDIRRGGNMTDVGYASMSVSLFVDGSYASTQMDQHQIFLTEPGFTQRGKVTVLYATPDDELLDNLDRLVMSVSGVAELVKNMARSVAELPTYDNEAIDFTAFILAERGRISHEHARYLVIDVVRRLSPIATLRRLINSAYE